MNRNAFCVAAGLVLSAAGAAGCGGQEGGVIGSVGEASELPSLEQGATVQRAYVGSTNTLVLGAAPVVATFDLVGGAQVELEVATADSSPLRYELWRVRRGGSATLVSPVDARSGFHLDRVVTTEDSGWALVFPAGSAGQALVHMDCVAETHGCTPARQPGESCPAGWSCDQGLSCQLPIGACGPLAGVGTCMQLPQACTAVDLAVCGCDGYSYANECGARMAGQPVAHAGPCSGSEPSGPPSPPK
jgi:hypothetical protein